MDGSTKIEATQAAIAQLQQTLSDAVADARREGTTWDEIALALGVARQSAWRRFKEERQMKIKQKRCSFCGDKQKNVAHLVVAPTGASICGECLDLAQTMVTTEKKGR